jgi:cytochrome c-type biogenesis protein CcmH
MAAVPFLIFGVLTLGAAAFACWPVLWKQRANLAAGAMLAGAIAALIVGIGGGGYLMLGQPSLAERSLAGPSPGDLPGLIAILASRVRERPNDLRGWTLLGRGYLTLQDPADAAAAFRRAIAIAPEGGRAPFYSAYGEALTLAAGGAVTADAEAAFQNALRDNPKDFASRYYLGLTFAARRDKAHAFALWDSLLADTPPDAPWRAELVDRMALLRAEGGPAPDVGAMVNSLAQRLKREPNDPEGWQRLIRAYSVLGDTRKAQTALADARAALRRDTAAQARLALEARELKLEK